MTFAEIQQDIRSYLLQRESNAMTGSIHDASLEIAVHHDTYTEQLINPLRRIYKRLSAWLGHDDFEQAACWHIAAIPPLSRTTSDYGDGFAETLDEHYGHNPALADLARLEWCIHRALAGVGSPPLDPTTLAQADWHNAVPEFAPTLSIATVHTDCISIWRAIGANEPVPTPTTLLRPLNVAVWLRSRTIRFRPMNIVETQALAVAREGLSLMNIRDVVGDALNEQVAADIVSGLFANWLRDGMIARMAFPQPV